MIPGIRGNLAQFILLVVTTAFVGGMVGLERSVLPLVAEREFGIASKTAILSFLVSFGIVKAVANVSAGFLADRHGRRRLLVGGWGLALGLNEFSGYGAVALTAVGSGYLAGAYGLRPAPFYLGIALAIAGLLVSSALIRETHGHARVDDGASDGGARPAFGDVFSRTSWRDRTLFSCSQAGLVNNFNDSIAWGLLPLFFAAAGLDLARIGVLTATYPAVWGVSQLATGALSDRWGRKWMIAGGMWLQAGAIAVIVWTHEFGAWIAAAVLLGLGTGLVYPTLMAAVSDVARPAWRATAVGVYRLWRDLGFAVGALAVGVVADQAGVAPAIVLVAGLTAVSGVIVALLMIERPSAPPLEQVVHHA